VTTVAPAITPPAPTSIEIAKETRVASVAGISGTVVDPSGAVVVGASVELRQVAGSLRNEVRSDPAGQFSFSGLAAGRYELRVVALGFRLTSLQVEVQPQQMASVRPELTVGSATDTVTVTAEASLLQTESGSIARTAKSRGYQDLPGPRPLPNNLPTSMTVTSGKTMLAVDASGAVFVSQNAGKSWKVVKAVWQGKVDTIRLVDSPQTSKATFELTTDSSAIWLSRDGSRWKAASLDANSSKQK
jgi:hypothetical protein